MRGFDRRNGVGRTRRQKSRLLMKWGNRCRRFHRIVRVVGESCTHFPFRMRCFFFVAPNRNRFQCWHSIAVASQKSNSSLPGIRPHPENEEQLAAMRILPLSQNVPPIPAQSGKRFPPPRHGHCPHSQKPTRDNIPTRPEGRCLCQRDGCACFRQNGSFFVMRPR